jgi:trk system potassium uptake protein TrkA
MFVIIAGVDLIGKRITHLLAENKHDVVAIDKNRDVCETIYAETGAMTVHGDATDIHVLKEAGAEKADVILCLMRGEADNIACALLSKSLGIPRIIARMRDPHYEQAYTQAGVTTIMSIADLLINQIMMEIEQPKVKKIMALDGGAEIYAVKIPKKAKSAGMQIKEITDEPKFPKECVFMGIYCEEDGNFLIPRGDYTIREGYTVFLISKPKDIKQATDIITRVP